MLLEKDYNVAKIAHLLQRAEAELEEDIRKATVSGATSRRCTRKKVTAR